MKSIKNKLIASVAMLLVATVMMTSASFAWFTVSTKADASSIDVTMTANKNLEIMIATPNADTSVEPAPGDADKTGIEKDETWGNKISSFGDGTLTFPTTVDGTDFKVPAYDDTGRMEADLVECADLLSDLTEDNLTANAVKALTTNLKIGNGTQEETIVAAYSVYLRSNVSGATITPTPTGNDVFSVAYYANDTLSTDSFTLDGTDATLVWILVYMDGAEKDRLAVNADKTVTGININFASNQIQ